MAKVEAMALLERECMDSLNTMECRPKLPMISTPLPQPTLVDSELRLCTNAELVWATMVGLPQDPPRATVPLQVLVALVASQTHLDDSRATQTKAHTLSSRAVRPALLKTP